MPNNENVKRAHANMTVQVSVTRDFGDVQITYGLTGTYLIGNLSELTSAYDEVRQQVETQFELGLKNRPMLMPTQLKMAASTNQAVVRVSTVRKESVQGKVRIRVLGGEYSTHGVAVYPEFYEALNINPDALEWGDNPYNANILIHLDGAGNPKRAVQIVEA